MRFPAILLALALAGCDSQTAEAPPAPPPGKPSEAIDRSQAGTPAPDVEFEDPAGEPASLADFRGKPVLVNLWATWCAPCIAEMPTLDALAARRDDIEVLAVSQDLDGQEKVDAFFAEQKFEQLDPYIDPDIELMTALRADNLPTTILYDAEGREVWRKMGIADWNGAQAGALIDEALAQ